MGVHGRRRCDPSFEGYAPGQCPLDATDKPPEWKEVVTQMVADGPDSDGRDDRQEIETLPLQVAEADARNRVEGRLFGRLKGLVTDRSVAAVTLRYKPYYYFDATLRKTYLTDDDLVYEGAIVVDPMTDISRAMLQEQVEIETREVESNALLAADTEPAAALSTAKGRRMQVEQQERGDVEMAETPRRVYKPVWLVELSSGSVEVVDGTTGEVASEVLL